MLKSILVALLVAAAAPAAAEQPFATPPGWSAERRADTGTTYFNCAVESCGRDSLVTVNFAPTASTDLGPTIDRLRAAVAKMGGRMVILDGPRTATVGGRTRSIVQYELTGDNPQPGVHRYWISGFFALGDKLRTSVVSSAARREDAVRNFETFAPKPQAR